MRVLRRLRRPLRCARAAPAGGTRRGHLPGRVDRGARLLQPDRLHAQRALRLVVVGGLRARSGRLRGAQVSPARLGVRCRASTSAADRLHADARRTPADHDGLRELRRGSPGVACSDSDNPDAYTAWSAAGAEADARYGYFGRLFTWWPSSLCAEWQGFDRDRYMGPFTRRRPTRSSSWATRSIRPPATRARRSSTG